MSVPKLAVSCRPASHLCHVNEKVEFFIESDTKDPLRAVISVDGEAVLEKRTVTAPARLTASLPFPGFLRCTVTPVCGEEKAQCGVGVDPEQIAPLIPEPPDFDRFWKKAFAQLDAIPADFSMERCEGIPGYEICRIGCANVNGLRAYAMLALPIDPSEPVPLVTMFGGGEAYEAEDSFRAHPPAVEGWMGRPCAVLIYHLPPYPPEKHYADCKARHEKFLKEIGLERYVFYGLDSPRRFYLYPAILGCVRLLRETATLPRIDRENIVYCGASHGGAFGLYLCCFSGLIRAAFCGVPDFGDVGGFLAGRHPTDCKAPEFREHWRTMLYFDTAFCAKRITCPVYMGVGFIDDNCFPTWGYAIYNALRGPKFMFDKIANGHADVPPGYHEMWHIWLAKQISPEKP